MIEVDAPPGLQSGDRVTVEIPGEPVLRNLILFVIMPAILLVGGVTGGYLLIRSEPDQINMGAILIGIGLMLAWYVAMHFVEKRSHPAPQSAPRIVDFSNGDLHADSDHQA